MFNPGAAAVHVVEVAIDPLPGEDNVKNNVLTRLVNVDSRKPRILYLEGEPRWEFKFLRRAVEDDTTIDLVTMLRTTQNKIYRQGIANPDELKDGFPTKVEELFAFDGLIIGSVDAPYFTPGQQTLIKDFVDRRGGGLLFLGGKDALSDGGWKQSADVDLIPTILPDRKDTFQRIGAKVELTAAGRDSLITRLEEDPAKNVERWKNLPYVMNFQDPGQPKPGATVLVDAIPMTGGQRASADHAELRPRSNGAFRHGGEAGAGRCCSRWPTRVTRCSTAVAALAGHRYSSARDHLDAQAIDFR